MSRFSGIQTFAILVPLLALASCDDHGNCWNCGSYTPWEKSDLAAANYSAVNSNQIAIADVNGDGLPDILIATGVSQTVESGVITNQPGVLLQSATSRGTFGALQDIP